MVSTSIHVKIAVDYSAVVASDAATFLQSSFLLLGGTCFGQAAGVVYMWSTRRAPQSCAMCATSAQGCDEEPHALRMEQEPLAPGDLGIGRAGWGGEGAFSFV